jgi:hypothetical protein
MDIQFEPKKVTRFFGFIVLLLTLAHLAIQFLIYAFGFENLFGLTPLFTLNAEQNVPALYATISILFCSVLLALIAFCRKKSGGPFVYHWAGLSAVFLFLAVDEALSLHENSTVPLRKALNTEGLLFYAWIIPYSLALVVLLAIYLKFLLHLPGRTRRLFILAGFLYVTGAMLFELPGGIYDEAFGRHNLVYTAISTVEEVLEMSGILVFIYALTAYIGSEFRDLRLSITAPNEAA